MSERIYIVGTPSGVRLVRASAPSQALSHVAQTMFTVRLAKNNMDDVIKAVADGVKVENYRNPDQQDLDLGTE